MKHEYDEKQKIKKFERRFQFFYISFAKFYDYQDESFRPYLQCVISAAQCQEIPERQCHVSLEVN